MTDFETHPVGTDDLVARLRNAAGIDQMEYPYPMCDEAADRIDQLEAALTRANAATAAAYEVAAAAIDEDGEYVRSIGLSNRIRALATPDQTAALERLIGEADELRALRQEHAEWSQRQFGDVSAIGPAKHLAKEALEVADAPHDDIEHADCWMLLWDMQRRAGISDADLAHAIRRKLAINKSRDWPAPQEGEAREHIKASEVEAK